MPTTTLRLPWQTPPLSLNDRGHHMARARKVADVRRAVYMLARSHKLPRGLDHVTVQLHYRPARNRRIDSDNLVGTLKPCCDALAAGTTRHPGYGMVPDDIPRHMAKPEPIIHPAEPGQPGTLWIDITHGEARS